MPSRTSEDASDTASALARDYWSEWKTRWQGSGTYSENRPLWRASPLLTLPATLLTTPQSSPSGGSLKPHIQSRKHSLIEATISTVLGYLIALLAQLLVFPALNITVTLSQNLLIGAIFMGISVVRTYYVRRLFNWMHHQGML